MIVSRRNNTNRRCVICKAPPRYQNAGVPTCEACKAFFRRSQQGEVYKTYRCFNGGNCVTEAEDRKSCTHCRFQRCLDAGMTLNSNRNNKKTALVPVANRQKENISPDSSPRDELESAAQELLQELMTLTCFVPGIEDKGKFFSMMEIFDLDSLTSKYAHSFYNIPVSDEFRKKPDMSVEKYMAVISGVIQRLVFFSNSITQFRELNTIDKKILFRAACSEVCMINAVIAFDKEQGMWLVPTVNGSQFYKNVPGLQSRVLEQIMGPDVYDEKLNLTLTVQKYQPDETVIMLLYGILLFTPTRPNLIDVRAVQKSQIHFAMLLRKYLMWRFGKDGESLFISLTKTLKGFRRIGPFVYETVHGPILDCPNNSFLTEPFSV